MLLMQSIQSVREGTVPKDNLMPPCNSVLATYTAMTSSILCLLYDGFIRSKGKNADHYIALTSLLLVRYPSQIAFSLTHCM